MTEEFVSKELLSLDHVIFRLQEDNKISIPVVNVESNHKGYLLTYSNHSFASCTIQLKKAEQGFVCEIESKLTQGSFASEKGIEIQFGYLQPEAMLGSCHDNTWWMMPSFPTTFGEIKPRTQSLLLKIGEEHCHLLPLCGENFHCDLEEGSLYLTSRMSGLQEISGAFLSIFQGAGAAKTFAGNFRQAKEMGAISIPLREERSFPVILEGFGFCTWDCCYQEVTSEKIYQKLDEFKEKKIPVQWVIIDDGWQSYNQESKLCSFTENREKFPEGLSETIRRMKEKYGIKYVGVWHTLNGYWSGIEPTSKLYEEQKDNLILSAQGMCLPALDEEKAFRFYDAMHTYLASCGVDFVKVDNQSSLPGLLSETLPSVQGNRIYHKAMDRSVFKHFGGTIINCMGMDMENVLSRPMSSVSRNSDDFFPKRENGFKKHLVQNVYSALWHCQLYYGDYDMWWSDHEFSVQSGVLRAISGSPIYVSDEINRSCCDTILPVIDDDGMIMRCEGAAIPTEDCVYTDCLNEQNILTVWNYAEENIALAAFNVSDYAMTKEIDFSMIPAVDTAKDYMAYEFFSKKWTRVSAKTKMQLLLEGNKVAVWSIYPVRKNDGIEMIDSGNESKYVPIASKQKKKIAVQSLLEG